jgi:hypothetical protein
MAFVSEVAPPLFLAAWCDLLPASELAEHRLTLHGRGFEPSTVFFLSLPNGMEPAPITLNCTVLGRSVANCMSVAKIACELYQTKRGPGQTEQAFQLTAGPPSASKDATALFTIFAPDQGLECKAHDPIALDGGSKLLWEFKSRASIRLDLLERAGATLYCDYAAAGRRYHGPVQAGEAR